MSKVTLKYLTVLNREVVFELEYGSHWMDFKVHINTELEWEPFCNGSIKWDHCMNIDIGEDGVMMHFCEAEDVLIIKAVTDKLYALATQIGYWDKS